MYKRQLQIRGDGTLRLKSNCCAIQFDDTNGGRNWTMGTGSNQEVFRIFCDNGTTSSAQWPGPLQLHSSGNVGIGTDAPSAKLCVSGNIKYSSYSGSCSDMRFKKDFEP